MNEGAGELEISYSPGLEVWLAEQGVSLAFAIPPAKLFLIGLDDEGGLSAFERTFNKCMALASPGSGTIYPAEHFSTNARATGVALSDGLGHVGGALAPLIVLGANSAWGFSSSFVVMAISGFVAGAVILMGIRATGRSLETATATAGSGGLTRAG